MVRHGKGDTTDSIYNRLISLAGIYGLGRPRCCGRTWMPIREDIGLDYASTVTDEHSGTVLAVHARGNDSTSPACWRSAASHCRQL